MANSTPSTPERGMSKLGSLFGALAVIGMIFFSQSCSGFELPPETPSEPGLLPTITASPTSIPVTVIVTPLGTPTPAPSGGEPTDAPSPEPPQVTTIDIPLGYGASHDFWQVFFTAPTGSRDSSTYFGGIDTQLAAAIDAVEGTIDIAAFEFNNPVLTQALLDARSRGVLVRMVVDNEHGLQDDESTLQQLIDAGVIVVDDGRTALMHNKFMILDGQTVWTGSWNYTINDTYRNNNNALAVRSRRLAVNYQEEFNEMFLQGLFGVRSPSASPFDRFTLNGIPMAVHFAPEDDVIDSMLDVITQAQASIRFMTFSFTLDNIADVLVERADHGVSVQGIYETVGSQTAFSTLRPLFCAGLPVRQDGSPFALHHKVFIVDDTTVITGSFNFSASATKNNDENMLIIHDPVLAQQYLAEFDRRWAEAVLPSSLTCE